MLVKCFAGCSAADVVHAVGLELHDLFPKVEFMGEKQSARPRRPRVDWPAMIAALERDVLLVKIVLAMIGRCEPINTSDAATCQAAATRIANVIAEGRHG